MLPSRKAQLNWWTKKVQEQAAEFSGCCNPVDDGAKSALSEIQRLCVTIRELIGK